MFQTTVNPMASIITHVAVPLSLWLGFRSGLGAHRISNRLLIVACIASMLPDLDVITFKFGIPYNSEFGHRGFTHSISFSIFIAVLGLFFSRYLQSSKLMVFSLLSLATLSHAILDAMTNGGLGVAFFWPVSDTRYFMPWQPIQVSPVGIKNFLSERGLRVLQSEFVWVWLPAMTLSLTLLLTRFSLKKWLVRNDDT